MQHLLNTQTSSSQRRSHERLRARLIRNYVVDDQTRDTLLDTVEQASRACETPVALISLLDSNRQWFKTTREFGSRNVELAGSICARAVEHDGIFIVPNALTDPRVNANPWVVGDPNVRFYAGAPLIAPEGFAIGTVCVLDNRPRTGLAADQRAALQELATRVMDCLDRRKLSTTQNAARLVDIESTMFALPM
jgi:GAF domain-containing protein